VLEAKGCREGDVKERIAGSGARKVEFDVIPTSNGRVTIFAGRSGSRFSERGRGGRGYSIGRKLEHVATIHVFPSGETRRLCRTPTEYYSVRGILACGKRTASSHVRKRL
jgi:hypothetical protein